MKDDVVVGAGWFVVRYADNLDLFEALVRAVYLERRERMLPADALAFVRKEIETGAWRPCNDVPNPDYRKVGA